MHWLWLHDIGSVDEFAGLRVLPASELDIELCRELFEVSLRLRPLEGRGWHVLVLEELDGVASKQLERYLKVKLEHGLPTKCIVDCHQQWRWRDQRRAAGALRGAPVLGGQDVRAVCARSGWP